MKRRLIPLLIIASFIVGLILPVFADRGRLGDPQPRPWHWGDPDWPALSKNKTSYQQDVFRKESPQELKRSQPIESFHPCDRKESEERVVIILGRLGIAISIRR